MDNYERLKKNLDGFISKHYLNEFLKGLFISLLIGGITWLGMSIVEYYGHLKSGSRTVMFFTFLATIGTLIISLVVVPLGRWMGLLKRKTDQTAAAEIGRKISGVDDRLSNLLSLEKNENESHNALLKAGIEQKSQLLNSFDFRQAIDLRKNLKWAFYLFIPLLLFTGLFLWNPAVIKEGGARVIQFNEEFIVAAPFQFSIENASLSVPEGSNFLLRVSATGKSIPQHVFLEKDGEALRMRKASNGVFEFEFTSVSQNIFFEIAGGGVKSRQYTIEVLPVPKVLRNTAQITFPSYTKLKSKSLSNQTQFSIPEGSTINWALDLKNVASVQVGDDESMIKENKHQFDLLVDDSELLNIIFSNNDGLRDSSSFKINSIKDENPLINAYEQLDSANNNLRYFNGRIKDDYGFSRLIFHASILDENGKERQRLKKALSVQQESNDQAFSFLWMADSLAVLPSEKLLYYFEVWDNDGVNGSKSTTSQQWSFEMPSEADLDKEADDEAEKTKDKLSSDQKEVKDMMKDLEDLKKDLLEKQKPDWEEKEALQEMLEKQKEMLDALKQKSEQQKNQNAKQNQYKQYSEEILQKQKRIEELFDELFNEEFKEKYEEWQELMEELNKEQMLEKVEELELDNEKLEKQLDRTLELFKELEFEKKVEDVKQKAEDLAEKQDELREKTEEKSERKEDLQKGQDALKDQLDELKDDIKALSELNKTLEEPKDLPSIEENQENAENEMQKSGDNLQKGNRGKSQQNQKKASDELQKMGDKLDNFQQEQQQSQQAENLEDMRQLLENLVDLSKNQEDVMDQLKNTSLNDPQYVKLSKKQKDIIDDTKVVEDSLLALSKRVPQIESTINDEVSEVKSQMNKALKNMTDQLPNQEKKFKARAATNQQYAMTSLNKLANLFDEIMQNMQNQMMENQGKGQCNKPGQKPGNKPGQGSSPSDLRKMQQSLNKQLEDMKKAMEKGKNPNGKDPGNQKGQNGQGGMSESLAKMAAEQSAIRQQLRNLSESLGKDGKQAGNGLKKLEELMEQTEEDILFQNISQETLKRQQEILTKLLESEKADREREQDNKRESQNPEMLFDVPDDVWDNYLKEKDKEIELYQTLPPNLKPFYRNRVNRYFSNFIIE